RRRDARRAAAPPALAAAGRERGEARRAAPPRGRRDRGADRADRRAHGDVRGRGQRAGAGGAARRRDRPGAGDAAPCRRAGRQGGVPAGARRRPDPLDRRAAGGGRAVRWRALVVEDEWVARNYLVELLQASGSAEVVAAVGGLDDAREVMGALALDVAFVDV